jgi:hypothetical protein
METLLSEKTTCQDQIKFISDNYFQMYKILQLFTSLITLSTNIFTSIKVIENACTHIYTDTKVIRNAELIKTWNCSKFLTLLNNVTHLTDILKVSFF